MASRPPILRAIIYLAALGLLAWALNELRGHSRRPAFNPDYTPPADIMLPEGLPI